MMSPRSVIATVENTKAPMPASTESESSVSTTLVLTLPHTMVASTWFECLRNASTCAASGLWASASICRRKWLRLNTARLRPANRPVCTTQAMMPSQIQRDSKGSMGVFSIKRHALRQRVRPQYFRSESRHLFTSPEFALASEASGQRERYYVAAPDLRPAQRRGAGGGRRAKRGGRGRAETPAFVAFPLPAPPPRAGEGARGVRGSASLSNSRTLPPLLHLQRPERRGRDAAVGGGFVGAGDAKKHVLLARLGAEHQRERQAGLGDGSGRVRGLRDVARLVFVQREHRVVDGGDVAGGDQDFG